MSNIYNFTASYNEATESVELSWDVNLGENIDGNVSYVIYKDYYVHDIISELTYKDSAISPETTYAYQVVIALDGEEVVYSKEVEVTIPKNNNLLVYTSKGHYNEIAKRIKRKLGSSGFPIKPHQMPFKIKEVYIKGQKIGKQAEYESTYNVLQDNGNRRKYSYAWYEYPGTTLNPMYEITVSCSASNVFYRPFYGSKIKEILKPIRIYGSSNAGPAFAEAKELERIILLDVTGYTGDFSSWFSNTSSLIHIRWNGEIVQTLDMSACVKLDGNSIYDTIIHLYQNASGKSLTLSQQAVNNATFPNGMTWDEVKALKPSGFTISLI